VDTNGSRRIQHDDAEVPSSPFHRCLSLYTTDYARREKATRTSQWCRARGNSMARHICGVIQGCREVHMSRRMKAIVKITRVAADGGRKQSMATLFGFVCGLIALEMSSLTVSRYIEPFHGPIVAGVLASYLSACDPRGPPCAPVESLADSIPRFPCFVCKLANVLLKSSFVHSPSRRTCSFRYRCCARRSSSVEILRARRSCHLV
jgi:hypothetical protein